MIKLPNFFKAFEYENNFWLTCNPQRIEKLLAQYELFRFSLKIEGDIIECGVFKGTSILKWGIFRDIFLSKKRIIGFDTFDKFPKSKFKKDRKQFVSEAGENSISIKQLKKVLRHKRIKSVKLIKGDILETVPKFKNDKISLLNLDTDLYEPAKVILEHLYNRVSKGGIIILDNYNTFKGETKAIKEFFKGKNKTINYNGAFFIIK